MRDDPVSVKLRKEHREWMGLTGLAKETTDMAETLADARPGIVSRAVARFSGWLLSLCRRYEEEARTEARKTYQDTHHAP